MHWKILEIDNSKRQRITLYILIEDTKTLKFRILKFNKNQCRSLLFHLFAINDKNSEISKLQ